MESDARSSLGFDSGTGSESESGTDVEIGQEAQGPSLPVRVRGASRHSPPGCGASAWSVFCRLATMDCAACMPLPAFPAGQLAVGAPRLGEGGVALTTNHLYEEDNPSGSPPGPPKHKRNETNGSMEVEMEFPVLSARGRGGTAAGLRRDRRRSGDTNGLPIPNSDPVLEPTLLPVVVGTEKELDAGGATIPVEDRAGNLGRDLQSRSSSGAESARPPSPDLEFGNEAAHSAAPFEKSLRANSDGSDTGEAPDDELIQELRMRQAASSSKLNSESNNSDARLGMKATPLDIGVKYGTGFGLYFLTQESILTAFLIMCLLSFYPFLANVLAAEERGLASGYVSLWLDSTITSVMTSGKEHGAFGSKESVLCASLLDVVGMLVLFLLLMRMMSRWDAFIQQIDEDSITLADYSVLIRRPNFERYHLNVSDIPRLKRNLRDHFANLISNRKVRARGVTRAAAPKPRDPVYDIVVVPNNTKILQAQREKHAITVIVKHLQLAGVTACDVAPFEGKLGLLAAMHWGMRLMPLPWVWSHGPTAPYYHAFLRSRLKHINFKINKVVAETLRRPCINDVFVTFNKEEDLIKVMKLNKSRTFMNRLKLRLRVPCEPSDYQWENAHVSRRERRLRSAVAGACLVTVILLTLLLVNYVRFLDPLKGDVIDCNVMYNYDVTFESTCFLNVGRSEAKLYFQGMMEEQREVLTEGVGFSDCRSEFADLGDGKEVMTYDDQGMPELNKSLKCKALYCFYCSCNALSFYELIRASNQRYCKEYLVQHGIEWSMVIFAIFTMTLVNFLMFPFVQRLVSFERHRVATKEIPSSALKLLVSVLLINGVIPIMMNADLGSNDQDNQDSKTVLDNLFAGSVNDFSYSWYKTSGFAFSMNFVLQMGFFWAAREPAMRAIAKWRSKSTAKKRARGVCGTCFCEKKACKCSPSAVEESRRFYCSKEVLEKFLSTLMNSNWPESADRIVPSVLNYKRLLDGIVYQYTVDHPVIDKFMQSVDSWEVSSFVRAEECYSFVLALKSYIRTKGKHEEASTMPDAEVVSRHGSAYNGSDSLSYHSSCTNTQRSFQESTCAPASMPAEVAANTDQGRDTRQLSELKMFVNTLVELGWPVPLGELDISGGVSSKDIRATLEGLVRRCCNDQHNFPGLQELVHGWWESLPMEDHSRFTSLPALLRKEIRRAINYTRLTQEEHLQVEEFDLASRWGKMLGTVYLSVVFSAGIPVLIYCACGFFALQMYADRYMLFNMETAPNLVSQKDAERMVKLLPLACILHCAVGSWMISFSLIPTWNPHMGFDRTELGPKRLLLPSTLPLTMLGICIAMYSLRVYVAEISRFMGWTKKKRQAHILQHLPPLQEAISSGQLRRLKSYRLQDNERYCRLARECVIGSLEDRMQIDQLFP